MGVFDGASDPHGTVINNEPAGLVASRNVAEICTAYFLNAENRYLSKSEIMTELSAKFSSRLDKVDFKVRPSTTVAIILDNGDDYRLLILGDTKIRVNANQVFETNKRIDDVSTCARVMVYEVLAKKIANPDAVEALARRTIFAGLKTAIAENIVTESQANDIVKETIAKTNFGATPEAISEFLMGGIQVQQGYSNNIKHPLGFTSMNGDMPILDEILDHKISKSSVTSLEIFTDGYFALPVEPSVKAWEDMHRDVEREDFSKTKQFATVKGSTSDEFSDDRTVLIYRA